MSHIHFADISTLLPLIGECSGCGRCGVVVVVVGCGISNVCYIGIVVVVVEVIVASFLTALTEGPW